MEAWNSACAWLLNFFPHSLQTKDLATSPSIRLGGKSLRSSPLAVDFGALISSMDLSWLSSSHCNAPCTESALKGESKIFPASQMGYKLTSSGLLYSQLCSLLVEAHVQKDTQIRRSHADSGMGRILYLCDENIYRYKGKSTSNI